MDGEALQAALGDDYVVRPVVDVAAERHQLRVIRLLAHRSTPIPLPEYVAERLEGEAPGQAFVIERRLAGESLRRESIDALGALSYRYAQQVAEVLRALAAVEIDGELRDALGATNSRGILVHGELTAENLLWNPDESRLVAVLGWTHVRLGQQNEDLDTITESYGDSFAATVRELLIARPE